VPKSSPPTPPEGILSALGAFFLWGVLPMFWKCLQGLPATSIIAHRTIWSVLVLWSILALQKKAVTTWRQLGNSKIFIWHLLSGLLLAANWLLYVWATLQERILETALGYYLNPFVNMLFGYCLFGETHSRGQKISIAIALLGVACQFHGVHGFPWIALILALTFSLYAVVRKKSPLSSLPGLGIETLLLSPIALAWLCVAHPTLSNTLANFNQQSLLLILTGVATSMPLLLFGHATRKISLTTLGILQFLSPTLQWLVGWRIYHESMTPERTISFALIWLAIALYGFSSWKKSTAISD
jgi:chloramphenicol-sensitive protein RarD